MPLFQTVFIDHLHCSHEVTPLPFTLFFSSLSSSHTSSPSPPFSSSLLQTFSLFEKGQSLSLFLLYLLQLLLSYILKFSRHQAKTLLSPPHLPSMNSPHISFLFICSSTFFLSNILFLKTVYKFCQQHWFYVLFSLFSFRAYLC